MFERFCLIECFVAVDYGKRDEEEDEDELRFGSEKMSYRNWNDLLKTKRLNEDSAWKKFSPVKVRTQ